MESISTLEKFFLSNQRIVRKPVTWAEVEYVLYEGEQRQEGFKMAKTKKGLPEFKSVDEAARFFETHSATDYQDEMTDVDEETFPSANAS